MFRDEFLVAISGIEAHTDDLNVVLLEGLHPIAEAACFLGATRRLILGIEVKQHDLLADRVGELPGFSILVFAFDQWGFIAGFWSFGSIRMTGRKGCYQSCCEETEQMK